MIPTVVALRERKTGEWGLDVEEYRCEDELHKFLLRDASKVGLVVICEDVAEPVRVAQRIHLLDDTLEVMMLCQREGLAELQKELSFSPFVGSQVRCHPLTAASVLKFESEAGAMRTADRRRHRAWLAAAQRSLALGEQLSTNSHVLERALDEAPIGILLLSQNCEVLACNRWIERNLEVPEAEVLGKPVDEALPMSEPSRLRGLAKRAAASNGAVDPEIFEVSCADRQSRWLSVGASLVSAEGPESTLMLIMQDVTRARQQEEERQTLEARVLRAQRLESLEILAGGIAHDFNNLLSGILGNTYLAGRNLEAEHPAHASLHEVAQAARAAANLTSQLLAYAGKGNFSTEVLDLSALIESLQPVLEASVRGSARLRLDLDDAVPPVEVDPTQIQQVLMNLVLNAAQSGDGSGSNEVVASTQRVELGEHELDTLVGGSPAGPGRFVALDVEDNGGGMDEATRARIFDPFFTTKQQGRGLGLAATLGIVHAHGGGIALESVPAVGTRFRVLLPASYKPLPRQIENSEGNLAGEGLILIVDDEEDILRAMSFGLELHGYHVILADSGRKALEFVRRRGDQIDLVILDMTMPGMSGEETFRALREIRPDAPVLLSSGYTQERVAQDLLTEESVAFIKKPYDPDELAERVKQMLRSSEG